jgi:hypothetical protein
MFSMATPSQCDAQQELERTPEATVPFCGAIVADEFDRFSPAPYKLELF